LSSERISDQQEVFAACLHALNREFVFTSANYCFRLRSGKPYLGVVRQSDGKIRCCTKELFEFGMLDDPALNGAAAILFYAFDSPVLAGADLRSEPLTTRRAKLRELISKLPDTIRFSETFDASASELMAAVRSNGLEGVVAKRRDSSYKPGDRSGAWVKVRANRGRTW
jgi:bifunctional non-homologous end joining protein LigD